MDIIEDRIQELFKFILARQRIYYKKEILKLNAPWTDDPILGKYKFCNVRRQDDRGTRYIIDNICNKSDMSLVNKLLNITLYRMFNHTRYFSIFGIQDIESYNFSNMEQIYDNRSTEFPTFSDAYTVCQVFFDKNYRKSDKAIQIFLAIDNHISSGLLQNIADQMTQLDVKSLQEIHLQKIHKVGGFLSQQIFVDLTYIPELRKVWDIDSYANLGPGAQGTSNYLVGLDTRDVSLKYKDQLDILIQTNKRINDILRDNITWKSIGGLDLVTGLSDLRISDTQSCFCEFRKYTNLIAGNGKKRQYFK